VGKSIRSRGKAEGHNIFPRVIMEYSRGSISVLSFQIKDGGVSVSVTVFQNE
jgi:hypothetical protein